MSGFAKYERREAELPAWKALAPVSREVYLRLKLRCFAEGKARIKNNGHVFRSPRDLAKDTGISVKSVSAGLADLQAKGWIVATEAWALGEDGKGRTATWRLTMMPSGPKPPHDPPTREPERWTEGRDYEVPVYASYLPKPRKGRIANVGTGQKTPNPNRAQWCAQIGRSPTRDFPENVVEVRPNRKHRKAV